MNVKTMYVIFYILIALAIVMMVMEYFEIQDYMVVCREYYNRAKEIPNINLTDIGEIR